MNILFFMYDQLRSDHLEQTGTFKDSMIVLTLDHGD